MAAMTTSSKMSSSLIDRVILDYPQFKFCPGSQEHWSPKSNTITYSQSEPLDELLGHNTYQSDFELLKLESEAWQLAAKIGRKYHIMLDDDHIQDCLDTYRDWLHRRSKCPTCGMHVMQQDSVTYKCFNCDTSWQVSSRRFSRSYRRKI
jgi:predicted RNA-binding Zn-ribbon protein involved in translation (DUF1610 family)